MAQAWLPGRTQNLNLAGGWLAQDSGGRCATLDGRAASCPLIPWALYTRRRCCSPSHGDFAASLSSRESVPSTDRRLPRGRQVKVSVALTAFNHEKFVARAVRSALEQDTDFDYEIVIGEDCSEDSTRDVVVGLAEEFPEKIRLLPAPTNLGARRNFVRTVGACKGEYIAVLDGDDYWTSPKKLQTAADFLDRHDECSICFHSVVLLYDNGDEVPYHPPWRKRIYTIQDLLQRNFIMSCSPLVRRGHFVDFPAWAYDNPDFPGDWTYLILNATRGHIGYIDELMGAYRLHGEGEWTSRGGVSRLRSNIKLFGYLDRELNHEYARSIARSMRKMRLKVAFARLFPFAIRPLQAIRRSYRKLVGSLGFGPVGPRQPSGLRRRARNKNGSNTGDSRQTA